MKFEILCTLTLSVQQSLGGGYWCNWWLLVLSGGCWCLESAVGQRLDLVDADQPVLSGISLLQHVQVEVLVADLRAAHTVEARRTT